MENGSGRLVFLIVVYWLELVCWVEKTGKGEKNGVFWVAGAWSESGVMVTENPFVNKNLKSL